MVCNFPSVDREIKAYETLAKEWKTNTSTGKRYVRQAFDRFQLRHGDHNYHFLVHEPLGVTLNVFLDIAGGRFPMDYVKDFATDMLRALEFIHSANVVHADLQARNILLRIEDESVLKEGEEEEIKFPSPRKITEQSAIFAMKELPGSSLPVLCDFGEARTGKNTYTEFIQPAVYRAPEVFLQLPWNTSVDIWNLGCMLWRFLAGRHLFSRKKGRRVQAADKIQLARMAALLGRPPEALLADSGPRALEFFNEDGSAKSDVPNETLESLLASSLEGAKKPVTVEELKAFLAFIRRTLAWTGQERPSASELLKDPWITNS
ncbi:hypothetical protein GALMADRAFT_237244 [Galerina marginata CBS 339.88]|uniref:Protein kinase domain-containing protein n=1 Tax=Galerina marginata (strain CBS 339.88) TaxID=685588 RepID=A0A067TME6_GALM3|nr:hypothetical protein GALMADRAFT_237244 [Galerina marginata CBS 339.88]